MTIVVANNPPLSRRLLALLALCITCGGLPVMAQPSGEGPPPSPDQTVVPLHIMEQGGEVGAEFDTVYGRDRNIGDTASFRNTGFMEYIRYRMRATIYRPDVLEIDSDVKLGLLQQSINNSGLSGDEQFSQGDNHTGVGDYNLMLSFFKNYPLAFSIRANRERTPVMELFTDRFLVDRRDYGATMRWTNKLFPMELSVGQSRYREWGFESATDSRSKYLDYTIRNAVGNWMTSELNYRYNNYHQQFNAEAFPADIHQRLHLQSNDVNLLNTVYLQPDHRSYLASTLHYFDQHGSDPQTSLNWEERLQLQHRDNLSSYYLFNYLRDHLHGDTLNTYRAEAGVDHKLFESLGEHLDLHWRQSDFANATEREFGPTARLDYHKSLPWGSLAMGYSGTVERVEHEGGGGVILIHREALTMRTGVSTFLQHPGVIVSSIVVTSEDRLTTFFEGFDYEVVLQGNRVALRPLPFGRLNGGQTVRVDYNVEFTGDISFTSADQDFNINYDFAKYLEGLSLYYRWHNLSTSGAPANDFSILRFRDNLAGFSYTWRGFTWREEYEDYHSTFGSYNQILSQVEGLHAIGNQLRWGWNAGFRKIDYKDGERPPGQQFENALFAGTMLRGTIRTHGYWEVQAQARKETGQFDETLLGVMSKLGFHWRKAKLELGVRAEERKQIETERDRFGMFLQFSREF